MKSQKIFSCFVLKHFPKKKDIWRTLYINTETKVFTALSTLMINILLRYPSTEQWQTRYSVDFYVLDIASLLEWTHRFNEIRFLKWNDRLLHGQSRQSFEWNYFHLLTGRNVLSNKKKENIQQFFLSIFQKKKGIWGTRYI